MIFGVINYLFIEVRLVIQMFNALSSMRKCQITDSLLLSWDTEPWRYHVLENCVFGQSHFIFPQFLYQMKYILTSPSLYSNEQPMPFSNFSVFIIRPFIWVILLHWAELLDFGPFLAISHNAANILASDLIKLLYKFHSNHAQYLNNSQFISTLTLKGLWCFLHHFIPIYRK